MNAAGKAGNSMSHIKTISIRTEPEQPTLGQLLSVIAQMMSVVGSALLTKESSDDE